MRDIRIFGTSLPPRSHLAWPLNAIQGRVGIPLLPITVFTPLSLLLLGLLPTLMINMDAYGWVNGDAQDVCVFAYTVTLEF